MLALTPPLPPLEGARFLRAHSTHNAHLRAQAHSHTHLCTQGTPVGDARCYKKDNESLYGPTESYAVAWDFAPNISSGNMSAVITWVARGAAVGCVCPVSSQASSRQ